MPRCPRLSVRQNHDRQCDRRTKNHRPASPRPTRTEIPHASERSCSRANPVIFTGRSLIRGRLRRKP
jgi:hypothetical protein